jgi:hypothetical protein
MRNTFLPALAMLALLAGPLSGPARAQEYSPEVLDQQVQAAETLAQDGKFDEALDALRVATTSLWEAAPLSFRRALWVEATPGGWGVYTPRSDATYNSGEDMIAYAEPVGFSWRPSGDQWVLEWAADMVIKAKDGTELQRVNDFQQLKVVSQERNQEVFASFTYTLTHIPSGEYVLDTVLRDKGSDKTATFSLPFVIR